MDKKNVVVIGSLNYDIIVQQDRMPLKGETYCGNTLVTGPGGKGSNQAAACALLGMNTSMIGCVGQDSFGTILKELLESKGVNVSAVRETGCTGAGIVHTMPDGDYYSTIVHGANYEINQNDIDCHLNLLQNADYVIMQEEIPTDVMVYAMTKLADLPQVTVLLNNAPAQKVPAELLNRVDYLILNETEASYMSDLPVQDKDDAKTAGKKLLSKVRKGVIITLGEKGSVTVCKNEVYSCEPVKVTAVDATGAGDSYIGALAFGLSQSMRMDRCMDFASHVSAIAVTGHGGQDSFPDLDQVYEKYPGLKPVSYAR